jgi:hypothetical protein
MAKALERLLPHCDHSPHKVASRLDAQHRDGEVRLLGGGVVIDARSNPVMLGIKAHIASDGRAALYVEIRRALAGNYPMWDGKTVESLERHHRFWAYDRTTFDAHFPAPVNRGGRPPKYDAGAREKILTEAAVSLCEEGPPEPLSLEALCDQVGNRLGNSSPGLTLLKEILGPLCARLKAKH